MPLGSNSSGHLFDTTFTTNGVIYSASSGVATSTAAGSAGQVLQSAGAGSAPAYSTATLPSTATGTGKILIADGTNWVASTPTYPNAASTALKHIKSDGTNFVTTTVTYPDASVTAGKVIISDGTNYIASTPTYPNAAGTSGNILTSDGTNWTSATPSSSVGTLALTSLQLTSAQIKALHATPIEIIAAPGAGKTISIVQVTRSFIYGGTNVFVAGAAQTISLYFNTNVTLIADVVTNAILVGTASAHASIAGVQLGASFAGSQNKNVTLYNPSATEITGNAANNNTTTIYILYYIVTDGG